MKQLLLLSGFLMLSGLCDAAGWKKIEDAAKDDPVMTVVNFLKALNSEAGSIEGLSDEKYNKSSGGLEKLKAKFSGYDLDKPIQYFQSTKDDTAKVKIKLKKIKGTSKTLTFFLKQEMRKSTKKSSEPRPLMGMHGNVEWFWVIIK